MPSCQKPDWELIGNRRNRRDRAESPVTGKAKISPRRHGDTENCQNRVSHPVTRKPRAHGVIAKIESQTSASSVPPCFKGLGFVFLLFSVSPCLRGEICLSPRLRGENRFPACRKAPARGQSLYFQKQEKIN